MDIDLSGRTAVVTGGSKGIGLAVVRELAGIGAEVIAGARSASADIEALARDKQVTFAEVDLADPGGPAELVALAGDRVDILVNNVGLARARPGGFLSVTEEVEVAAEQPGGGAPPGALEADHPFAAGPFLAGQRQRDGHLGAGGERPRGLGQRPGRHQHRGRHVRPDWATSLNLNLLAAVRATRAALPGMLAARSGAIVMTCSVNARLPDPAVIDYSAAKAALAGFAKALSKEVGSHGIRVNTVSPGPVATDLWLGRDGVAATVSQATGATAGDVESQAAAQSVTGRFTQPAEVARMIVYLASDHAANVTGSDFTIDGGLIPTW